MGVSRQTRRVTKVRPPPPNFKAPHLLVDRIQPVRDCGVGNKRIHGRHLDGRLLESQPTAKRVDSGQQGALVLNVGPDIEIEHVHAPVGVAGGRHGDDDAAVLVGACGGGGLDKRQQAVDDAQVADVDGLHRKLQARVVLSRVLERGDLVAKHEAPRVGDESVQPAPRHNLGQRRHLRRKRRHRHRVGLVQGEQGDGRVCGRGGGGGGGYGNPEGERAAPTTSPALLAPPPLPPLLPYQGTQTASSTSRTRPPPAP